MSESDSDEVAPDVEDEGPIFPYEKLYYSAQDKEEIMALPEIKREEILSERAAQVDRHNQDLALRRLLASREREQARAEQRAKRKASATDLEEGQRKSTRQKTTLGGRKVGETSGAIEAYKRQREQKGKRDEQRRREADARRAQQRSPSHEEGAYSDAEAEDESEVEEEKKEHTPPKDDPPAGLKDIQRVRVGRSNFAMVCFYPTFEKSITGCFTRVNIGPNRETGQNEYRVCIIKSEDTAAFGKRSSDANSSPFQNLPLENRTRFKGRMGAHLSQTNMRLLPTVRQSVNSRSSPARTRLSQRYIFLRGGRPSTKLTCIGRVRPMAPNHGRRRLQAADQVAAGSQGG